MTPQRKNWIKENLMGIIIACMFTAFWVQYENDRQSEKEDRKTITREQEKQSSQIQKLTMTLLNDPDTDDESKEVLREYLRMESRGATIN